MKTSATSCLEIYAYVVKVWKIYLNDKHQIHEKNHSWGNGMYPFGIMINYNVYVSKKKEKHLKQIR